jgi:hypothetical protein
VCDQPPTTIVTPWCSLVCPAGPEERPLYARLASAPMLRRKLIPTLVADAVAQLSHERSKLSGGRRVRTESITMKAVVITACWILSLVLAASLAWNRGREAGLAWACLQVVPPEETTGDANSR